MEGCGHLRMTGVGHWHRVDGHPLELKMAQKTRTKVFVTGLVRMCHRTWRLSPEFNTPGDSMKGANAKDDLLAQSDSDGGLIGVASLQEEYFNVINRVV